MRRCEHCGTQYGDKVSICPVDGQPTVNPQAQSRLVSGAVSGQAGFNAKVVSPMSAAGSYRIFIQGGDLLFIQIESGSNQILNALIPLLGPFGGLVNLFGWLFSRRKVNDFNERLQSVAPENLLRDSEKNFRLHLAEIRQAVIEPAAATSFSGKEVGRADLTIRQGERWKLAFAARADMDAVWQLLASGFSSPLQADVEWNVEKQQYQKNHRLKTLTAKTTCISFMP
jgi:hypothetical protein